MPDREIEASRPTVAASDGPLRTEAAHAFAIKPFKYSRHDLEQRFSRTKSENVRLRNNGCFASAIFDGDPMVRRNPFDALRCWMARPAMPMVQCRSFRANDLAVLAHLQLHWPA